jgi:hypothetical protein
VGDLRRRRGRRDLHAACCGRCLMPVRVIESEERG